MSNIVAAVRNLQAAHDYYKESYEDCRAVIKQLTEGVKPGEIEYIHPIDMGDMLNDMPLNELIISDSLLDWAKGRSTKIWKSGDGRLFKQSPYMPQKSKRLK